MAVIKEIRWNVGDVPRFANVYKVQGANYDPDTVTLTIMRPDGTSFTPGLDNFAIGSYRADITVTQSGVWRYRWEATGPAAGVDEDLIFVRGRTRP